jgi:putative ABC transport system permease protein
MNLATLAWLGLKRRPLSTALTALYVALGAALALVVAQGHAATQTSFRDAARGFDLVLAPKNGSGLQAVLATMFFVDEPAGTVPWSVYEQVKADTRVRAVVPYAMGDMFRGHRVVGTTRAHFEALTDGTKRPLGEGVTGRIFEEQSFEAVVGSLAARTGGLGLGAEIQVTHGTQEGGLAHAERWNVVGVLRPTGTPQDRAVFIPLETFYDIEGHGGGGAEPPAAGGDGGEAHEAQEKASRRLSAVGVRLGAPHLRLAAYAQWRDGLPDAQPVLPTDEILRLLDQVVAPLVRVFRAGVGLMLLVGGLGILVGLYNTLQGRRREIAILRALGARPRHVFALIVLEAVLLCLLGGLLGLVLGHGALAALSSHALMEYGVRLDASPGTFDLWLLLGLAGLGALAGLLPAWRGYHTPVATNLTREA